MLKRHKAGMGDLVGLPFKRQISQTASSSEFQAQPPGEGEGGSDIKRTQEPWGSSSKILKRTFERYQDPALRPRLEFFHP